MLSWVRSFLTHPYLSVRFLFDAIRNGWQTTPCEHSKGRLSLTHSWRHRVYLQESQARGKGVFRTATQRDTPLRPSRLAAASRSCLPEVSYRLPERSAAVHDSPQPGPASLAQRRPAWGGRKECPPLLTEPRLATSTKRGGSTRRQCAPESGTRTGAAEGEGQEEMTGGAPHDKPLGCARLCRHSSVESPTNRWGNPLVRVPYASFSRTPRRISSPSLSVSSGMFKAGMRRRVSGPAGQAKSPAFMQRLLT